MGLLSFLKRNDTAPAAKPVADTVNAVQQLRVRARRRLIGAALLVALGIVGFPLVFETQPRPIAVDLPIEIPRKEQVTPLTLPPAQKEALAPAAGAPEVEQGAETARAPSTQGAGGAKGGSEATLAKPAAKASTVEAGHSEQRSAVKAKDKPVRTGEDARVQALLEGKPVSPSPGKGTDAATRFVVQVGAFADAGAAHETRLKVERLGLKTYTQVIDSAAGKRTRVRVGPFATREEADKALGRIRAAGLAAATLTL